MALMFAIVIMKLLHAPSKRASKYYKFLANKYFSILTTLGT